MLRVEIKVTGSRASGKTYLLEQLERDIRAAYRQVRSINRVEEAMIDGLPVEILELEVSNASNPS